MNKEEKELYLERLDSVEININSKGYYSGKIKVYRNNIKEAYKKALEYANKINKIFKHNNNNNI